MSEIVHIIHEEASPMNGPVWTMVCGEKCIALDNGDLIPYMDFTSTPYGATCRKCCTKYYLPVDLTTKSKVLVNA